MGTLKLERINQCAPYQVWQKQGSPNDYYFENNSGLEFVISIRPEYSIIPSGAYEFGINNPRHGASPSDPLLRETVFAIIQEFFRVNGSDAMLYITETGDGRQALRNRLFVRWFNNYEHRDVYTIHTAEGLMEGQMNFFALISRLDNPRLAILIDEFDETMQLLFD